jgi:hypothetical protein
MRRNGTALRKSRQQDLFIRNATFMFTLNKSDQHTRAVANSFLVDRTVTVEGQNVVPRPHRHATVNRDRANRGVRKNKTQIYLPRKLQLRNDRFEIVAVCTKAVQPDNTADRFTACIYFYGLG